MLKDERYDKILKILETEKYITANELSGRLYVSLPTIRRDLATLHKAGKLTRSHGGAKNIDTDNVVAPLSFRKTLNSSNKNKLCKVA